MFLTPREKDKLLVATAAMVARNRLQRGVKLNYPETIAGKPMKSYVDWFAPTFLLSLTSLPVASVPCGLDSRGLPVGLQIVGPPMGEEKVLALARQVQESRPVQWKATETQRHRESR